MTQAWFEVQIRPATGRVAILDFQGDLTRSAEEVLLAAFDAAGEGTGTIVLNLSQLDSIDTLGIALLLRLHGRARQRKQRLVAYGLKEHCRRAFELTYLNEVVALYAGEAEAMANA
jgi:anti-anti-sigma factor